MHAVAEAIAKPLMDVWRKGKGEPISISDRCVVAIRVNELPMLSAEQLKNASRGVRPQSASSEGWHPRHVASLSVESREALSIACMCAEVAGDYPPHWQRLRLPVSAQSTGVIGELGHLAKPRIIGASRRCGVPTCVREGA